MSDRRNESSTTRSRRPETDPSDDSGPARVRAEYEEYTVGESTVVMITDPLNEHAWMHATGTVPVER
jgi:hypothetical protein